MKNIFKDFYKEHKVELDNRFREESFFYDLITDFRKIRRESPKKVKEQAGKLLQKISDAGVDTGYFIKGLCGYITKQFENEPTSYHVWQG